MRKSALTCLLVITLLAIWVCALAAVYALVVTLGALLTGSSMGADIVIAASVAVLAYVVSRVAHAARRRGQPSVHT